MDTQKTVSGGKLNKKQHTSTLLENAVLARIVNSGARVQKQRFGESLEDEVCNAKEAFSLFLLFISQFLCLFLPFKHFVQELRNRTRYVLS